MAAKKCARAECGKTVYPMEELKCLDQVWHKQCFRCTVCNMVLTMKNYKGYNKLPYCEAHYPQTKATVIVDTPEMKRLAENTRNQSLVKYHEDFEKKMKGRKIDVADDPETQRFLKNTQIQSGVIYHGDLERKDEMERIRPPIEEGREVAPPPAATPTLTTKPGAATCPAVPSKNPAAMSPPGRVPLNKSASPYSSKLQQVSTLIYSSEQGGRVAPTKRVVGSIDDYDPLNGQWGSVVSNARSSASGHATNPALKSNVAGHYAAQPRRGSAGTGLVFRAMYDYQAADTDEVTFKEGDVIVNCQYIDQGWMTGTVQRTGKWGMLPANYVEKVH